MSDINLFPNGFFGFLLLFDWSSFFLFGFILGSYLGYIFLRSSNLANVSKLITISLIGILLGYVSFVLTDTIAAPLLDFNNLFTWVFPPIIIILEIILLVLHYRILDKRRKSTKKKTSKKK